MQEAHFRLPLTWPFFTIWPYLMFSPHSVFRVLCVILTNLGIKYIFGKSIVYHTVLRRNEQKKLSEAAHRRTCHGTSLLRTLTGSAHWTFSATVAVLMSHRHLVPLALPPIDICHCAMNNFWLYFRPLCHSPNFQGSRWEGLFGQTWVIFVS